MRADPKIASLFRRNPAFTYWLIQAWDIAKNGPGARDELRNPEGGSMTDAEFADLLPGATRALVKSWRLALLRLEIADEAQDGALRFPALCKRQGLDRTGAERTRRWRERRHGDGHGDGVGDAPVTVHIPDTRHQNQMTEGQSPVGATVAPTVADQKKKDRTTPEVSAVDLPGDVVYEIERLAEACTDRDAGTVGRLVAFARRGAGVSDFADARAALGAVHRVGSPSRYACSVLERRLAGETGGA